jgi:hypothetical protein
LGNKLFSWYLLSCWFSSSLFCSSHLIIKDW